MKKIFLKSSKAAAVRRFHPWVFSGAVQRMEGHPADGEVVEVRHQNGQYLATGHYQDGSICVRIFSFEPTEADTSFWQKKLQQAYDYRLAAGLINATGTDCYRLVHAEGDGMPGLIIDIYGQTAVVQCHSIGMHLKREQLVQGLQGVYGDQLTAIYDKSKETLPGSYASSTANDYLWGEATLPAVVQEHGHQFEVNWITGQKTGFFLDQRDNRHLLGQYASNKVVLNAFCYTGGFSVYALQAGASRVDSVDISQKAIDLTNRNVALNGFGEDQHQAYAQDVLKFLKETETAYDIMVVDPPAFAKSLKKRHNAVQGYKRLNALALQKVKPGGLVFTFSCSQVIDMPLFYNTIVAAALEAKRQVRVMHRLSQPADHPVSLFHPEGAYLKGLVLEVG
jgi:23S rRNA (cytosine1962-C5)-methyltransferase